mmetsp:Transcript_45047/g.107378  ORF Transcript_45047/g.107378 Transcript_45047/m.107378 type:complete len:745 (-) Transcript_45047:96-2330(-)
MSQPPKKNAFVIHAFKQQPPKDTDMPVRSWKKLHEAITQIFNEDAGALSFEELYRTGYNMVLHKHGDLLYQNVEELFRERSVALCEKAERNPDETFLASLKRLWLHYKRSLLMVRDILMYMDRTYVKMNKKRPVFEMGLAIFCQHCTRTTRVKDRIRTLLLHLIHMERNGDKVDRDLIRSITQMLKDMGDVVFAEDFEQPFKAASQEYYMVESVQLISTSSTPEYLRKVEVRLQEEAERVKACLFIDYGSGEGGIKQVVEDELIGRHMHTLVEKEGSGLVFLLEEERIPDLARMSDLLSRVAGGQDLLESKMAEHVTAQGREVVQSPEHQADPLLYVHKLLALKDKYDGIIASAFRGNKSFTNKLHKSFEAFVNLNPRAPEYISLAMDSHLRGSKAKFSSAAANSSEEQAETQLEKALQMFRFVQEKDLFEKYYKQHLARRLLGDRSQSEDMERKVIQMLKTECGYQFTAKLEGMFKDINTSRDLQLAFRQHVDKTETDAGLLDLSVKVLTTGYWPTQPSAPCQLPPVLDRACALFKRFYLAQHNGRQLTWQSNMGNADLKARYDKSYLINIPSLHMVVLLLFNQATSPLSCKEMEEATSIPLVELKRVLQSLACGHHKLLVKEPKGKDVADADTFSFNEKFTNKMIKFKVASIAAQRETTDEVQASRNKMNEDRNPQIDAAIVRVMKSRRVMDHNNLIAEVTKQLQARFNPNPMVMKKRIEGLIDRDFLQRQRGNIKTYEYLA